MGRGARERGRVQPGHRAEDRGAEGGQVFEDLERVALVKADRRAAEQAEVDHHRLEDVRELCKARVERAPLSKLEATCMHSPAGAKERARVRIEAAGSDRGSLTGRKGR